MKLQLGNGRIAVVAKAGVAHGRAEAFQAYDEGSIPFTRSKFPKRARVAQW